MFASTSIARVV